MVEEDNYSVARSTRYGPDASPCFPSPDDSLGDGYLTGPRGKRSSHNNMAHIIDGPCSITRPYGQSPARLVWYDRM